MHLLTSYKSGAMKGVPQTLPPGLYEAASRRTLMRSPVGSRSGFEGSPSIIPRQMTGSQRTQSPVSRKFGSPLSAQSTGGDWLVTLQEKAQFDSIFATVDTSRAGLLSGEKAVEFFMQAQLPEETLAQIWDLADIDADGQLTRDEFAVAMHLVRQVRSGREPLPQTLPPALVPPAMRQRASIPPAPQPVPSAPVTAPAAPHSAAEDLFGLDSFAPPAAATPVASPQVAQSTGGSNSQFSAPPSAKGITTGPSTTFKPFVPTSAFGQSLQPQMTGQSTLTAAKAAPDPSSEDLLGDNDPEESKKLTQDTTDLANLSNQVGSLSKEMHGVQEKRTSAEKDLSQSSQQKRDFEARLSQARTMYEQEVKAFKALEERLKTSKAETTKLQQDYALIDGSRQDLQAQHSQVSAALAADQQENASLKEKIRTANAEVAQLKPALEKARSAARQQKGLTAINKKQLATVEGERDKTREEIDTTSRETEAAQEPASRAAPAAAIAAGTAGAAAIAATTTSAVTSPAASTTSQNTNPFFRKTPSSDRGASPPPTSDQHAAFDSLFGTAAGAHSGVSSPPPTSFRTESPTAPQQSQSKSPASTSLPTPSTSPSPNAAAVFEPPAVTRQFTSSSLPLAEPHSTTTSTGVLTPASRVNATGMSSSETAGASSETGSTTTGGEGEREILAAASEQGKPDISVSTASQAGSIVPTPVDKKEKDPSFDELFGQGKSSASQQQGGNGFDDVFASMDKNKTTTATAAAAGGATMAATNAEFPPIRELDNGDDDDDDSSEDEGEKPMGFDDNFAPDFSSPQAKESTETAKDSSETGEAAPSPKVAKTDDSFDSSTIEAFHVPGSMLSITPPPINSQPSPPKYDDGSAKREASFPAEYGGLLPSRADPTSPPDAPNSIQSATGAPIVSGEPQKAVTSESIAETKKPSSSGPDFEAAFSGLNLAPAKEVDDDDGDESDSGVSNNGNAAAADVDFSFDSPQPTKAGGTGSSLFGFSNDTAAAPSTNSNGGSKSAEHDWDAIFAPLESSKTPAFGSNGSAPTTSTKNDRQPGWALAADSGDDMILQRLTGMGFPRDRSLDALERFDYNLDKVGSFICCSFSYILLHANYPRYIYRLSIT